MAKSKKSPPVPAHSRVVTPARARVFLEHLARCGVVAEAARLASPHALDRKGASGSFHSLRRRDPVFAVAWEEAQEQADAALLIEARRRAVHGTEKGIFQKGARVLDVDPETGKSVPATEKVYSDRLLELLLKSRFPTDFVERKQVEHLQKLNAWQITAADLVCLSDHESEALASIMATIMAARGDYEPDPMLGRAEIEANMKVIEHQPAETVEIAGPASAVGARPERDLQREGTEPSDKELVAIEAEAEEWEAVR